MLIKESKCTGCGTCVIYCPVQAITLIENKAVINRDLCVECNLCYQNADCPGKAIKPERLKWPRVIRNPFSSVVATHRLTGVPGRGTEEMKTNDLTNRFEFDELGISIELGRPGVGTLLKNIEYFTLKLSEIGVEYEKDSPVTALLIDEQGHVNEEVKNERVLSAIIEFKIPTESLPKILRVIEKADEELDTVFTVGIVSRVMADDSIPVIKILEEQGFDVKANAKINIGLGKRKVKEES